LLGVVHGAPAPTGPPSFPTRRSSDLCVAALDRVDRFPNASSVASYLGLVPGGDTTDYPANPAYFARVVIGSAIPPVRQAPRRGLDRKSTRLNSSHGSNSYADFCLTQQ